MNRTRGQLESEVSAFVTRFVREYMGRGPVETRTFILEDMVLVRLRGTLTPAEQQLVKDDTTQRGRDLIKQVRLELFHRARPMLTAGVTDIVRVPVRCFHTDISTRTGEQIIVLTLHQHPIVAD